MGIVILISAFVTEAAFAIYCMITQSNQERIRSLIRIGMLAAFALATLTSVIQWSFRWYGLAALLVVWAAIGAWTIMGKRPEKKEYKAGRNLARAIATLLLVFIAVTPALIFPQYKLPKMTGKHRVATSQYTYTDASRAETFRKTGERRQVNVKFWYPADAAGTYPLVVFDHGAFGVKTSNRSTFMELASNGYVVCSIDHPYHSLYTIGADGHLVTVDQTFFQEVIDINHGKYTEASEFKLEQGWMQLRTTDINFVLDTVLAQAKKTSSDTVYQHIDPEKIGLIGHSLGGEASAQVARERNDIDAVINLDADLIGEYVGYVDGKYVLNDTIYPVPLLTILGDDLVRLMDAIKDPTLVIAVKHITATAPQAFEIHLAGTDHMSFTDLPLVAPLLVSLINASVPKGGGDEVDRYATLEKMNQIILTFFNVYLKGEGSFTTAGM